MKVLGLGGIFYKCQDPAATRVWYEKHLGVQMESWGAAFKMKDGMSNGDESYQVLSPTKIDNDYFAPSEMPFMLNLRVSGWAELLEKLKSEGIKILGSEEGDFGKFAWILDPNGVKIELWEQ